MKRFSKLAIMTLALISLGGFAVQDASASERLHLPGKPVERSSKLVAFVFHSKPVRAVATSVAKAKPARSVLKLLFK